MPGTAITAEDGDEAFLAAPEALTQQESWWAAVLVISSGFDLLGSLTFMCFAFKYAFRDDGVSLYCLGIQAISHMLSSMALVMRFMGELLPAREDMNGAVSDECLLREQRRRDLHREQGLAIFMGLAMLVGAAALLFKAFRKIKFWDVWYLDHTEQDLEIEKVTDLMAWWGFGGYLVQAVLRFLAARKIRRSLVWHCFTVSVVCLVFFFALGLAAKYEREWSWKAEPMVAMVLVFVMLVEAIRIVVLHLHDVDTVMGHDPRA